ncbi:MAG: VIT domain-containing protein [Gemmataceae bacterium]
MNPAIDIMTAEEFERCRRLEGAGFGALETPKGLLPLEALDVQAKIDGLLSQLTVKQTFVNAFDEPLEATYIFPLPDRAAVTGFRMEVAGRVIEGDLKERGEARREYDAALKKGHRAAIAEEERPDVFNLRVGNLMPGEKAVVTLTLVGPVQLSDNEATFRFPLVVAPRYIPGLPLPGPSVGRGTADDTDAVPDASRISPPVLLPGFPSKVALALGVEVNAGGLHIGALRSSLHTVISEETADGSKRLRVLPGEKLDRDFILRFRTGGEAVQTALSLAADPEGKQGVFLLTLVPPLLKGAEQRRDVIFILDRSGSMSGWKMVAARRALGRMVDTLGERDRFNVLAFDNEVESPPEFAGSGLVAGSDRNRFRALEFLGRIESRGGTELARPLKDAVRVLAQSETGRDRVLILVTDGQVGNEDQILKSLGKQLQGLRVFTLGIDQAVNAAFLQRLAQLGGGACELVESEDRLDEVMTRIHRRIGTPVITDVEVKAGNLRFETRDLVPGRLPELHAGSPVLILGRYQRVLDQEPTLTVTGKEANGRTWSQTVAGEPGASKALTATWARGRIRDLEDQYAINRDTNLERQIVDLSLGYHVLSRFTAYVAVDQGAIVNPGGVQHQVTQPVELPAGWEAPMAADAFCLALDAGSAGKARASLAGPRGFLKRKEQSEAQSKAASPVPPGMRALQRGQAKTENARSNRGDADKSDQHGAQFDNFVDLLFQEALNRNATEIQIMPMSDGVHIYFVIDGQVEPHEWQAFRLLEPLWNWLKTFAGLEAKAKVPERLPLAAYDLLLAKLKARAGLDPSQTGSEQRGRIDVNQPGMPAWLEVEIKPGALGESVRLKLAGTTRERFWA